jgi:hypothetical protein
MSQQVLHTMVPPCKNAIMNCDCFIQIYSRGAAADASVNDLVYRDEDSWGVGSQVTTVLLNNKGEVSMA